MRPEKFSRIAAGSDLMTRAVLCSQDWPCRSSFKPGDAVRNHLREQMGPSLNSGVARLIHLLTQVVLTSFPQPWLFARLAMRHVTQAIGAQNYLRFSHSRSIIRAIICELRSGKPGREDVLEVK
jgi:hypothetical protein